MRPVTRMKVGRDVPSPPAIGFLGLALAVFLVRGAGRALHGSTDLGLVYLAVRAWAAGANPYSVAESEALAPPDFPPTLDLNGIPSPHAPGLFPLFFFYRWLDWSEVVVVNLLLGCVVLGFSLWSFCALLDWSPSRRFVLLALLLVGYPLSTGVALGQPTVLAVAMALFVLQARLDGRRAEWVGLFAALGLLLKPQLGIALPLYLLFRRDVRAVGFCGGFYALANGLSLAFMRLQGAKLRDLAGVVDGIVKSNATQADPFCCVNLNGGMLPLPLALGLIAVALVLFAWQQRPAQGPSPTLRAVPLPTGAVGTELSDYGVAVLASLLAVYHRPYDLAAVVPLLWFVLSPLEAFRQRVVVAGLLFPMMQPVPWLPLARELESGLAAPWATAFHAVARPLHSWTLLALLYFLVLRGASTGQRSAKLAATSAGAPPGQPSVGGGQTQDESSQSMPAGQSNSSPP